MSSTRATCRCNNCGTCFTVLEFRKHPSYRVQPDVAGDPEAVLIEQIDCACVSFGRSTLSIELSAEMLATLRLAS